ncbi:hypothetical protein FWH13_02730 [Candidatus Saccharibacteria bacterium]|nr:hypothetical protein [Candidatus Saccharibacteria bacterium]
MWIDPADLPRLAARHDFLLLVGDHEPILPHLAPLKPRLFQRAKDKKSISVDEMREIINQNVTRHLTRQYFLLPEADLLTPAAQNSALKLLEEPNEHAAFIWIVPRPAAVLPTIRSRAHLFKVRLPKVPPDPDLLAEAESLLFGTPLEKFKVIKHYEKDRPGAEKLLATCAHTLDQKLDLAAARRLQAASKSLAQNIYPRLALLKII